MTLKFGMTREQAIDATRAKRAYEERVAEANARALSTPCACGNPSFALISRSTTNITELEPVCSVCFGRLVVDRL